MNTDFSYQGRYLNSGFCIHELPGAGVGGRGGQAKEKVPIMEEHSSSLHCSTGQACQKEEDNKRCASRQEFSWDPLASCSDPQNEPRERYGFCVGPRPPGEGGSWLFFQYLPITSTN